MDKNRELYEQKSEVLLKRLLSKFYSLEANYLETKMNAQKKLNKIGDNLPSGEEQIQKIRKKQEELTDFYRGMMTASQESWKKTSSTFRLSAERINERKQNITERTQGWLNSLGEWITEQEERTEHSSEQYRDQLRSQLAHLKKQKSNLNEKIQELHETTGENWEKVSSSISDEVNSMTTTIDKFYQHLFAADNSKKDTKEA